MARTKLQLAQNFCDVTEVERPGQSKTSSGGTTINIERMTDLMKLLVKSLAILTGRQTTPAKPLATKLGVAFEQLDAIASGISDNIAQQG